MKSFSKYFSSLFITIGFLKLFEIVQRLLIGYKFGLSESADVYWSILIIPDALIILTGLDSLKGIINSEFANSNISRKDSLKASFSFIFYWVLIYSGLIFMILFLVKESVINLFLPGFPLSKKEISYSIAFWFLGLFFLKALFGFLQTVSNAIQKFLLPNILLCLLPISLTILIYIVPSNQMLNILSEGNFFVFLIITIFLFVFIVRNTGFLNVNIFKPDFLTIKILKGSILTLGLVIFNQLFISSKNFFASFLPDGSISILSYSSAVSTPINMIIFMSIFSVLLTNLSIKSEEVNRNELKIFFIKILSVFIACVVPTIVFLIAFRKEILTIFYLRGNFNPQDIGLIEKSFIWDAMSIFSYVLYIFPTALYLAIKRYKLISIIGCSIYAFGIFLNYFLSNHYGYVGLSISNFFITLLYGTLLLFFSQKTFGRLNKEFVTILKIVLSCAPVYIFSFLVHSSLNLESYKLVTKTLFLSVIFGLSYLIYDFTLGILKVEILRNNFKNLITNFKKNS